MLRSEAITIIKRGLGFRPTQDSTIISALQWAQRQLELGKTLPNFLLQFDTAITVTADTATITLPTGFIRFSDEYELYYTNSDAAKVFLPRKNYTEAYTAYVASGEEDDSAVIDTANTYGSVVVHKNKTSAIIIPTPTVSYTAYLTYYKAATVLSSDIENVWLANAPDALIGLAGMQAAQMVRDKDAVAQFSQMAKLGTSALLGDIIEDELAGRGLVMGRNN